MFSKIVQAGQRKGRGTNTNPASRFDRLEYVGDGDVVDDSPPLRTEYYRDHSRTVLSTNRSPDVHFEVSLNPYRGCEHGCIYCYARPTHEYFGLSAGLDFESKIFVKEDAATLLSRQLSSPRWQPQLIALSGVTDPYQPAERQFQITRECLETLTEFRNPVGIITKSHLVCRDIDLLREMAGYGGVAVSLSITTLRPELHRILEPRAAGPEQRLRSIEKLAQANIPVRVMAAPIIPGLTDYEVPQILRQAAEAGARGAGYIMLRLPHGVKELFGKWLEDHVPERKDRVLARIRDIRDGMLTDTAFHHRMKGQGRYAEQIRDLFHSACNKYDLDAEPPRLQATHFRVPGKRTQLKLF